MRGCQRELKEIERAIGLDWFDAFVFACLISPNPYGRALKLASQRLANWASLGHLDRREVQRGKARWEYRIRPAGTAQPVRSAACWIPAGIG